MKLPWQVSNVALGSIQVKLTNWTLVKLFLELEILTKCKKQLKNSCKRTIQRNFVKLGTNVDKHVWDVLTWSDFVWSTCRLTSGQLPVITIRKRGMLLNWMGWVTETINLEVVICRSCTNDQFLKYIKLTGLQLTTECHHQRE